MSARSLVTERAKTGILSACCANLDRVDWTPFTCLNSLRDVEPSINLILDERGLGDNVDGIVDGLQVGDSSLAGPGEGERQQV